MYVDSRSGEKSKELLFLLLRTVNRFKIKLDLHTVAQARPGLRLAFRSATMRATERLARKFYD